MSSENNSIPLNHVQLEYTKKNKEVYLVELKKAQENKDYKMENYYKEVLETDKKIENITPQIQVIDDFFDEELYNNINLYSKLGYKSFDDIKSGMRGKNINQNVWNNMIKKDCGIVKFFDLSPENDLYRKIFITLNNKVDKNILKVFATIDNLVKQHNNPH